MLSSTLEKNNVMLLPLSALWKETIKPKASREMADHALLWICMFFISSAANGGHMYHDLIESYHPVDII